MNLIKIHCMTFSKIKKKVNILDFDITVSQLVMNNLKICNVYETGNAFWMRDTQLVLGFLGLLKFKSGINIEIIF